MHLPEQVTFFPHSKVAVCNIVKWSLQNGYESHADKYVLGWSWGLAARKPPASIHISYSHSPISFACCTIQYMRVRDARVGLLPRASCSFGQQRTVPPARTTNVRVCTRDMSPHRLHDRARLRLPPHVEQSLLANRTGAMKPSHLQKPSLNVNPIPIRLSPALLPTV